MNREVIIPNMHVILVHYPLGVFFTGLIIELLSIFWRRHSVRTAGRWMLLIGGLATIPTAMSGIYALHDVAVKDPEAAGAWKETVTHAPLNDAQWHTLRDHVLWSSIGSAVVAAVVITFFSLSDRLRKRLYFPLLGVLLFGSAILTTAAWHGGEAVYRHGVAVDPTPPSTQPIEGPLYERINAMFPPVQFHAIMAGVAAAVALASVGVAFRRITGEVVATDDDAAESLVKSLEPQAEVAPLKPGKAWLVTAFFFILTALGGWYVLGSSNSGFAPKALWDLVADRERDLNSSPLNRRFAHVIAATATIVLPLVLAMVGRWAPRRKLVLLVLSLVLLAAIGIQVWLGVLLLFDTPSGPVVRFN